MEPDQDPQMPKRVRVRKVFRGQTRTVQSEADACDINKMMANYQRNRDLRQYSGAWYGDFSNVGDYMDYKEKMANAQRMFMELPSAIRKRFGNNPAELLEFVVPSACRHPVIGW